MNAIQRFRAARRWTTSEMAQYLDTSREQYEAIEAGVARSNHPAVRTLENELHKPYSTLRKDLK